MADLPADLIDETARRAFAKLCPGITPTRSDLYCYRECVTAVLETLVGRNTANLQLKDNPAFRAGRELLIEGGEKAIDMIESGHFYEDHDASTEALGDLRNLLGVVKDTLK